MSSTPPSPASTLFERLSLPERRWVLDALRDETVGGVLLLVAAVVALVWANSPWGDAYAALVELPVGPAALHLDLPLGVWAADGLLAVFFYVAGVELKHELVLGSLSRVGKAVVPVAAALGGMVLPAALFVAVNLAAADGSTVGWAIPMATDIAFALAVLAVVGRRLPVALRAFLLTLAVVDDLGAITVIAIFYSEDFALGWFLAALACLALFWLAQQRRIRAWWVYVPLALVAWYCTHEAGVHATVAGVALGLLTRVRPDPGEAAAPAARMEHLIRPFSAAVAVPLFAFFAAGVDLRGIGLIAPLTDPVGIGVLVGLVVGKPVGVVAAAWLTARFTRARLSSTLRWSDVTAVGLLAGIGFTVSLLITELAYDDDVSRLDAAKTAILAASVVAALLASVALLRRNRYYRDLAAVEEADADSDGVPDVYQQDRATGPTG